MAVYGHRDMRADPREASVTMVHVEFGSSVCGGRGPPRVYCRSSLSCTTYTLYSRVSHAKSARLRGFWARMYSKALLRTYCTRESVKLDTASNKLEAVVVVHRAQGSHTTHGTVDTCACA